tara:strand:- start:6 stop:272 length:267 start_codon:yes stop_codon:yes gene_type:complete
MEYIYNKCGSVFSENKQKLLESNTHTSKKDNHRKIIQNKLNLIGWGAHKIRGFMIGDKYYKVKLEDGTLITMEKDDGRVMHILQDWSK